MTRAAVRAGADAGGRRRTGGRTPRVASLGTMVAALLLPVTLAEAHPPSPAETYRWVDPPAGITSTPRADSRRTEVPSDVFAAGRADVWTSDLQAIVTLEVTDHGDGPAYVSLSPDDPTRLPALPAPLVPNGNAYHVEVATPGWRPAAIELRLATPFPVVSMWSLEGDRWIELDSSTGSNRVSAPVPSSGVLLAAAEATTGHDSWGARLAHDPLRPALITAASMVALLAGTGSLTRRRSRG